MGSLRENIASVQERIARAAQRAGRDPSGISLVVITKEVDVGRIREVAQAGAHIVGENKVQDALPKIKELHGLVSWHMVGHLQTNKVKEAVRVFDLIHSVDSLHLAREINSRALSAGKIMDVLIQVNTSGEEQKSGLEADQAPVLIAEISSFKGLAVRGLMTIGPFLPDPEQARPCFRMLRELRKKILAAGMPNVEMDVLSMGMSGDFEIAVEEGATMVRVGTAIFGPRNT